MATASGLPAAAFQYAILLLIGVAVVIALKAIGIVLVNAMLIFPAATSSLVARRLPGIVLGGLAVALSASLAGLLLKPPLPPSRSRSRLSSSIRPSKKVG